MTIRALSALRRLAVAFALVSFVLAGSPPALAVVKNIQVISPQTGQPLAGTRIEIFDQQGDKVGEQDTDDKGFLLFDFPGDGRYVLRYPGGTMDVVVKAGIPSWAVGAGIVTGIGLVAAASDSGSSGGSGNGGGGGGGGGGGSGIAGSYPINASVNSNPDNHPNLFNGANCNVTLSGSTLTFSCSGAGLSFTASGTLESNNSFSLLGTGTYAGFSTNFAVGGMWNPATNSFAGTMIAGEDGALPDSNMNMVHEPISVAFSATKSG